jgi:hypothetical protein
MTFLRNEVLVTCLPEGIRICDVNGKVKVVPVDTIMAYYARVEEQIHSFLTSAQNGGSLSASAVLLPMPIEYEARRVPWPVWTFLRRIKSL